LVKTERMEAEEAEPAPGFAWLIGAVAWFIPGVGHLLQQKWWRAALMGGAVWICFFVGLGMGGHLFDLWYEGSLSLLRVPPMIADIGTGAPYFVAWLLDYNFKEDPVQAARTTYEYGTAFLWIAGLLNYLTMLDAFDIAAGRKP